MAVIKAMGYFSLSQEQIPFIVQSAFFTWLPLNLLWLVTFNSSKYSFTIDEIIAQVMTSSGNKAHQVGVTLHLEISLYEFSLCRKFVDGVLILSDL